MCFDLNEINSPEDVVRLAEELIEGGYDVSYVLRQLDNWSQMFSQGFSEIYNKYPDCGW